ncbi:hypothetical protein B2J93_7910 [Marssonina coronariae]|uniref:Uncharacterized protein n=1 Tax=Diplocarpon coronariae TaxID=2795749 RepID=A0A218ZEH4_9HELO|nr:hypothetical protein B2J93_7910 [Marssonina coronariae]
MSTSNSAVGALVIVPIVIAISVAFIAINFSQCCKRTGRSIKNIWNESCPWSNKNVANRRRKLRRSNLRSSQLYADSWLDLESIDSRQGYSKSNDQSPQQKTTFPSGGDKDEILGGDNTAKRVWHPSRNARLAWSFANPNLGETENGKSASRSHFGLSNVVRPSPTARRPERLSDEDAAHLMGATRKRHGRRSVVGLSLDEPQSGSEGSGSTIEDIVHLDEPEVDLDITPKARPTTARIRSAGAFLKSELHQRSFEFEPTSFSVRDNRHAMFTPQHTTRRPPSRVSPPKIPERRLSKSKNFFLRAIGGRLSDNSKSVRRKDSEASKSTSIHRIPRSRNPSPAESYTDSIVSTDSAFSFQLGSLDIADVNINPRLSSYVGGPSSSASSDTAAVEDIFVLCPQITITPEIPSVDTGSCFLWVAIEVTGTLQKADGCENRYISSRTHNSHIPDIWPYGRLHSMRIDLHPGQGCFVSEIVGDLHKTKIIRAGETQLILAKIRFNKFIPPTHIRDSSSDGLIAQLENDLGDTLTPYLTVRLTYKHSAFPNIKSPATIANGMSMHITRIQTEATAVIKRHNPLSAWSPRTSQTINSPLELNPLIGLVETYLPSERAREVIRKLANERTPIPLAKRFEHVHGAGEETVKPTNSSIATRTRASESVVSSPLAYAISTRGGADPPSASGPFARLGSTGLHPGHLSEEVDPARKVWAEMRRASRGGGPSRHPRGSISADHYFSVDEGCSPSQHSSSLDSPSAFLAGKGEGIELINEERSRIMDMALRNKRSVGQESLKSIVPSVARQKLKGGALSGLGLGVGRTWGWNGNWW